MAGDKGRSTAVWEAVRSKRMIRSFDERPLERAHLERILDAARHAGSSKNLQRWEFIVVERPEARAALAAVGPLAGPPPRAPAAVPPRPPSPPPGPAPPPTP